MLNNDRVIQTSKGRIIVPLAFHRSRGTDPHTSKSWDARAIATWLYSDDEGATWQESASWWAMPVRSGSGLQEPGVVELADGSLFSWCRTDQGGQYGFLSTDAGKTWSPPVPTEMKSPNGPASIKRLPGSSDLLALYNDHSGQFPFPPKKRNPFVAAISSDGGKTWPQRKLIESDPDGLYHYTAIHFVGDAVLLGYCAGDSKVGALNRLRIRRLTLDELRASNSPLTPHPYETLQNPRKNPRRTGSPASVPRVPPSRSFRARRALSLRRHLARCRASRLGSARVGRHARPASRRGYRLPVAPPTKEKNALYRLLEDGAAGLMIPHVGSAEEARALVEAMKFPPLGDRGFCGGGRDADYWVGEPADYTTQANRETFLTVQIETPQALENVGGHRRGARRGHPLPRPRRHVAAPRLHAPRVNDPKMLEVQKKIAAACRKHGKAWGRPVGTAADARAIIDLGAQLIAFGSEFGALHSHFAACAAEFDDPGSFREPRAARYRLTGLALAAAALSLHAAEPPPSTSSSTPSAPASTKNPAGCIRVPGRFPGIRRRSCSRCKRPCSWAATSSCAQ